MKEPVKEDIFKPKAFLEIKECGPFYQLVGQIYELWYAYRLAAAL